jgi:hypothetical protein
MLCSDEDGNQGQADEMSFTTNPRPFVSGVKASDISIHTAYIPLRAKTASRPASNSGKRYPRRVGVNRREQKRATNTIKLDNQLEGALYHNRIVVEDDEGNTFAGDDYVLKPCPFPKIMTFKAQQVSGMATATLRLLWTTTRPFPRSSLITRQGNPRPAKDQISLTLKRAMR